MKRPLKLFFCIMFLIIFFLPGNIFAYIIHPTQDAHVHQAYPGTNYGNHVEIITGCDYGSWVVRTYLTFDLSSIPSSEKITGVSLNMYQENGMGYAYQGARIHYIANDSWTEGTITWNNRPDGGSYGDLITYNDDYDGTAYRGWSSWDLLSSGVLDISVDQADGFLSLLLKEQENGDQGHYWWSSEYDFDTSLRPYLEITTAPIPIPSAIWLLGSGVIGLVGFRKKLIKT